MASNAVKQAVKAPSKLQKILANLNAAPRLDLTGVKTLKLTYAYRNDHWGARHFAKEHLPRIRWANPELDIQVEKVLKTAKDEWRPELEIQLENGQNKTINLAGKWSTSIVKELMEIGGGSQWQKWKEEAQAQGGEVIPGEKSELPPSQRLKVKTDLPSLSQFRSSKGKEGAAPIPDAPSSSSQASASL
ncbi:hypothetical protein CC1G_12183 [Coprinopsis cinerea okayama7|uniref:Uncharacterized protein n=1 Tax=Coprinopsis cinerea (strain Okayama-7 / 130 / ATCC MYA-4618 / FGSC 9003) TaxID=240176 RepID=A8N0X3_COPC7|nr:hypothetical protein CC1G_12183 [Coprinopsis cinerea okayama7\|eukprot:XP_001828522.1 hypothetical protein CC1G_12183 [Coprinopsis cinerea okayama7\